MKRIRVKPMIKTKWNIEFDEENHIYKVDGKKVPSVTEILKFLSVDTSENANAYLRELAADRGTRVHEATIIYDYEGYDPDVIDYDIEDYIKAYAEFVRDYRIKGYILTEYQVTNGEYAGTLDRLAYIDGRQTLIDFKTGTTVDPRKEAAQLYAYANLLVSNHIYGFTYHDFDAFILRLKKDGTYTVQSRDLEKGKQFFDQCFSLYKLIEGDKRNGK
jgi:hypothetical protein